MEGGGFVLFFITVHTAILWPNNLVLGILSKGDIGICLPRATSCL